VDGDGWDRNGEEGSHWEEKGEDGWDRGSRSFHGCAGTKEEEEEEDSCGSHGYTGARQSPPCHTTITKSTLREQRKECGHTKRKKDDHMSVVEVIVGAVLGSVAHVGMYSPAEVGHVGARQGGWSVHVSHSVAL
jgi:hypothetical protein